MQGIMAAEAYICHQITEQTGSLQDYQRKAFSLAVKDDYIFAGTYYYGVFMSTNNGTNWTESGLSGQIVKVSYYKRK